MPERETQITTEQKTSIRTKPLSLFERAGLALTLRSLRGKDKHGHMFRTEEDRYREKLTRYGKPAFDDISKLFGHEHWQVGDLALEILVEIDQEATVEKLLAFMDNPQRQYRDQLPYSSFRVVAELSPDRALPILQKYLKGPYCPHRHRCVEALGMIPDQSSIGIFKEEFMQSPWKISWESLAKIDPDIANQALADFIEKDEWPDRSLYYFFQRKRDFEASTLENLIVRYHQAKGKSYRLDLEYLYSISSLVLSPEAKTSFSERKFELIDGDRRVLSVLFRKGYIPQEELPCSEDEREREAIILSGNWIKAKDLGLPPVETLQEFVKIHPRMMGNFFNEEFNYGIIEFCDLVSESDLQDQPIETLEELRDISKKFNLSLVFKLIKAGLPEWESLEMFRGTSDWEFREYVGNLIYKKEIAPEDEPRATNVVASMVEQTKYFGVLEGSFEEWMYEHPHPQYVRYLVRGLHAIRVITIPAPDPDGGLTFADSYTEPDFEVRELAVNQIKHTPWINADYLNEMIKNPENDDIREDLERIADYK